MRDSPDVTCKLDEPFRQFGVINQLLQGQESPLADGHGRNEDCSSPPVQIRACGFPAPGSCLRSNVIGLRGIGYPCSSDPWARCFSDMQFPALCPGHALQRALPLTGCLPSTVSAADVTVGHERRFPDIRDESGVLPIPERLRHRSEPTLRAMTAIPTRLPQDEFTLRPLALPSAGPVSAA